MPVTNSACISLPSTFPLEKDLESSEPASCCSFASGLISTIGGRASELGGPFATVSWIWVVGHLQSNLWDTLIVGSPRIVYATSRSCIVPPSPPCYKSDKLSRAPWKKFCTLFRTNPRCNGCQEKLSPQPSVANENHHNSC